ncbi:hypothetical protein LZ31DRAFT_570829 [Colletotrichum somersetense]|nr:hypothetical protein LZ31DRAFT_570829 [Colletotrichum somersetense]
MSPRGGFYGCLLGGFLLGIDTGIIGPVTVMESFNEPFGYPNPTAGAVYLEMFMAGRVVAGIGEGFTSGIMIV